MTPLRPVEAARCIEPRIAEAADGDTYQMRKHFEPRGYGDATLDAKRSVVPAAGFAESAERPCLAFHPDRVVGVEGRVGKGAAAPLLAIETGASIDDGRRATHGHPYRAASARSFSGIEHRGTLAVVAFGAQGRHDAVLVADFVSGCDN